MKNVPIITYDTSTKNISFIAGFDNTANVTENWKIGNLFNQNLFPFRSNRAA